MAHALGSDHRLIIDHRPEIRIQAGQIIARDDSHDTGKFFRLAWIDAQKFRVRVRASQRLRVEHVRQNEVGGIINRSGDLCQPAYHRDICTDQRHL